MSLKARLLAGIGVVLLVLVLALALIYRGARGGLLEQVDNRLAEASDEDRRGPFGNGPPIEYFREDGTAFFGPFAGNDGDSPGGAPERFSDLYEGIVRAQDGAVVTLYTPNSGGNDAALPHLEVDEVAHAAATGTPYTTHSEGNDERYRVASSSYADGYYVVSALSLADMDETLDRLLLAEGIGAAAILGVLALVGWWVIHLGIRPVESMTRTATAIADGDLSHRVDGVSGATEAGRLGAALNQMLGTIEASFAERDQSEAKLRQFVADASHELRTPITTIRGYAELYRSGGLRDQDELDEALRRTQQEAVRMSRLIDDLLTLARLDQRRPMDSRPVDVSVLVRDAARDAGAVDPARVVTSTDDGEAWVLGDDDRLRQVLANVVGNALVHTPATAAVDISAARNGSAVTITVRDEGPGMTAEQADRATERFFRVDPARSRHRGGSGLGLAIADTTVAAHGGRLDVTSAPGDGTSIIITLPLLPAPPT